MAFWDKFSKLVSLYGKKIIIKDKDEAILELAKEIVNGGESTDNKILTSCFVRVDNYNPTGLVENIPTWSINKIVFLKDNNFVDYFGNLALCPDKFYMSFLLEDLTTITKWNLMKVEDSTQSNPFDYDIIINDEIGISEDATVVWCLVEKYINKAGDQIVKITYKAYQEGSR